MPDRDNPYASPTPDSLRAKSRGGVQPFIWLNLVITITIAVLVFASFYWFSQMQKEPPLNGRYATYDREVEVVYDPLSGIIMLLILFAIPNIVLIVVQSWRRGKAN